MGFIDALEDFSDRFPEALEELRELKDEFDTLVSDAVEEGTELFTIGFDEMVVKDNNDWQTSYSNNDEAKKLVAAVEENHPELQQKLTAQREHTSTTLRGLEETRNRCIGYLTDMIQLAATISPLIYRPESYTVAVDNISKIKQAKFFCTIEDADESSTESKATNTPLVQNAIKRNHASKQILDKIRTRVNDSEFVQSILHEELSALQQLSTAARSAIALFESIEKALASCVSYKEATDELQSEDEQSLSDERTLGITQIYAYVSPLEKIFTTKFLDDSDVHVSPAFNDLLNTDAQPFIQASSKICRDIKELMRNADCIAVLINQQKRPASFIDLPVENISDIAVRTEHDDE